MNTMPPPPSRAEWLGLFLLLCGFFGFDLATCNYYPTVWCDDVWWTEPALNLVQYGSFTSCIFQLQPFDTFPAVNCPLYAMALVPWLAAVGTSLLAARALNYTLLAVNSLLLWVAFWRFGWVRSAWLRLLALGVLHLGYGMCFSYRNSRPDMLGMLCLLLFLFAFAAERRTIRYPCLFGLAAASVWIGLPIGLFAASASFAAWLLLRRVAFKELVVVAAGMLVGAGSLALFFWAHGVLHSFCLVFFVIRSMNGSAPHLSAVGKLAKFALLCLREMNDPSLLAVIGGLAVLLAMSWRGLGKLTRQLVAYCLLLSLGVVVLFNMIGYFALYYSYMRFVPAVLALFAVYCEAAQAGDNRGRLRRWVFELTVVVAVVMGLPFRLVLASAMYDIAPRSEIRRQVRAHVTPSDGVFTEQAAFFEAKQITRVVYDVYSSPTFYSMQAMGTREFTPERKNAVTVLIVQPGDSQRFTNFFGGSWTAVSPIFGDRPHYEGLARLPLIGSRLAHYAVETPNRRRPLQIFRRQANPAP
jgi:hypothetical protein